MTSDARAREVEPVRTCHRAVRRHELPRILQISDPRNDYPAIRVHWQNHVEAQFPNNWRPRYTLALAQCRV